jgi:hypothetical protein
MVTVVVHPLDMTLFFKHGFLVWVGAEKSIVVVIILL